MHRIMISGGTSYGANSSPQPLIKAVPYKIHTVLTDNGIQFTDLPKTRLRPIARWRVHVFDMLCAANSIEHRLTKPNHPRTNGQVERMNRTLKEAKHSVGLNTRPPINLQGVRLARFRYAPIATKFRSVGK